ncbi:hypothetical protein F5876DRAFT_65310 [Lentinula aff. lateritia]|uniref:Uncharacterized protein n=1 Tax=Lentinula aff. lateritia TaxID=2804960 RepID=A0ACC1U172_9AGAR|nr:hypothetical protein F5876DRAFT_65310 [Lentinula aff. lateritia]
MRLSTTLLLLGFASAVFAAPRPRNAFLDTGSGRETITARDADLSPSYNPSMIGQISSSVHARADNVLVVYHRVNPESASPSDMDKAKANKVLVDFVTPFAQTKGFSSVKVDGNSRFSGFSSLQPFRVPFKFSIKNEQFAGYVSTNTKTGFIHNSDHKQFLVHRKFCPRESSTWWNLSKTMSLCDRYEFHGRL